MRSLFVLLLLLGNSLSGFAQRPVIQNIRLSVDEQTSTVRIVYDLTDIQVGDSVAVVLTGAKSGRIIPRSVQGDVGTKVQAGTDRTIIWNALQDQVSVDEDVVVILSINRRTDKIIARRQSSTNASPTPQRGTVTTKPRKAAVVLPVAGFALAAGLGAYSQLKPTNYKAYQEGSATSPSQAEIDQINQQITLKQVAYVAAAVIALADVSYLLLRKKPQSSRTAVRVGTPLGTPSITFRRTF